MRPFLEAVNGQCTLAEQLYAKLFRCPWRDLFAGVIKEWVQFHYIAGR